MQTPNVENLTAKVLVLGAYGFIGSAVVTGLINAGFDVDGLGRNKRTARLVLPQLVWHFADLADMQSADDWTELTEQYSHIVNCAGALQDNGSDRLEQVHYTAIKALTDACAGSDTELIQISAVGAVLGADTPFMATKAKGDEYIRNSQTDYVIFHPGLVLAKTAYGGSALMRMLAAFPWIQPIALAKSPVQTVALDDVCDAVVMAVQGDVPLRADYDLVEDEVHTLADVIRAMRHWLGFSPAKWQLNLPDWITGVTANIADGLSRLGWRSPLRSSAITVLHNGIEGDAEPWTAIKGQRLCHLDETLHRYPAQAEDRIFARMALLMPLIIAVLAAFWILSGIIGLWQLGRASDVLVQIGWSDNLAKASVGFWSIIDIALGIGILIRKFAKPVCWAMVFVSLIYLASAAFLTPHLWSDPLGPMVKVLPTIVLALVARVSLENR